MSYRSLWLILASLALSLGASARPVRVSLDWFPDAEFAGIFVAKEKGWYQKAGLDIELAVAGFDVMPVLRPGKADIGIHSGQDLIRHIARGEKLKVFAANYQASPICILVGQDSGITELKQLKGKTVGIFAPQDNDTFRIMLGNAGLSPGDVKVRRLETIKEMELVNLLKSREIAAIPAWEFNWPLTLPLLGYKVRTFPGYDHGLHFYGIVYFAREELLRQDPALLATFLRGTVQGWKEVFRDVDAAAQLIVDKYYPADKYVTGSKELTLKQQAMELKLAQRFFFEGVGKERVGAMSEWKWQRSIDIARKHGIIPKKSRLKPRDVFTDAILDAAYEGAP